MNGLFSYTEFFVGYCGTVKADHPKQRKPGWAELRRVIFQLDLAADTMRQSNTGPTRISQKPTVPRDMVNLVFSCGHHHWKKSYFLWQEYPE